MPRLVFTILFILIPLLSAQAQDKPAAPPEAVSRVEEALLETGLFRAIGVLFNPDQSTLRPEAQASLNVVGTVLDEHPALQVEVGGHTDASGAASYNQQLSEARAQAVRTYLIENFGLPAGRVEAKGYGEKQPLTDNTTATGRALNRRVTFRVLNANELEGVAQRGKKTKKNTTPADTTTREAPAALRDSNRTTLRQSIRKTARKALRERLDTTETVPPSPPADTMKMTADTTASSSLTAAKRSLPLRTRWHLLGQPFRAALPYAGARFGAGPDQAVVGVRASFKSEQSWLRLAPEAAFGYRDGFSLHVAMNAMVPITFRWTIPYRPYAGLGAALYSERWLEGLDLGLHVLLGVQRRLGSKGFVFAEYGAVDYFRQNRVLIGYRLPF